MLYFKILFFSFIGPLLFSFLSQVKFYRHWHIALFSSLVVSCVFIPWDTYFTLKNVWGFNATYVSEVSIFCLPLEEVCFFMIIPFCSLFVYQCIAAFSFFPKRLYTYSIPPIISMVIAILLFIAFYFFRERAYTASVCLLSGILLLFFSIEKINKYLRWGQFILSYVIVLIPFFIVNGLLTYFPVVWYNNDENLGIRVFTIPIEDFLYNFILFSLNVWIFNFIKFYQKKQ